jgi:hypothetical protein
MEGNSHRMIKDIYDNQPADTATAINNHIGNSSQRNKAKKEEKDE